jgi:hypothetical protein
MQGKVRPFNILRRLLAGMGGGFEETLRNLPARIAATNLRNYALGIKIRYCGTITNADMATAYTITRRELLHALGTISYKDAWGSVIDNLFVDRLAAANLEDRFWNLKKIPLFIGALIALNSTIAFQDEVIIPYAPGFFSVARRDSSMMDGMFAASLLGEEASIRFAGVGGQVFADPLITVQDVTITVDVVCCQTKEIVAPIPLEIRDDILPITTNPFIATGDVRKYFHLFSLSQAIGTTTAPIVLPGALGSLLEILIDADGHTAYQGPQETLWRDIENSQDGHPAMLHGAQALAGFALINTALFYGEMWSLIDPCFWEKATQGQACKRLEVRGVGPLDARTVILMSERRYETPSSLLERFADREGLSDQERKDLRIGNVPAGSTKLRRSEAIAVPVTIASRKERKE